MFLSTLEWNSKYWLCLVMDNRKSKDFLSHLISFHFRRAGIRHCLSEVPRPNWSIMVIISVSASSKTKLHAPKWLKYNEKVTLSNASVKMTPYYGSNEVKINFNSVRDLAAKRCPFLMPLGKHHVILPKEVAQVRIGQFYATSNITTRYCVWESNRKAPANYWSKSGKWNAHLFDTSFCYWRS